MDLSSIQTYIPSMSTALREWVMPWLELRLALIVHQLNEEMRMDAAIKNLAGTVNEAIAALSDVPNVAAALKDAAVRVAGRVSQVKELTHDLETADAALARAVDGAAAPTSNGGPPLVDSSSSSPGSQGATPSPAAPPTTSAQPITPVPADLTVEQARRTVEAQNAT